MDTIPYGRQFIDDDDILAVSNTLKSDYLTTGNKVLVFEQDLAKYTNAKYVVALANGTASLHIASLILLKENDEVLTTVNSFLATSNAILYAKAKPVFIDIEENGNIDLDLCEQELKKNKNIKALYVVSFSGNTINQDKLKHLRATYDISILEDSAHSMGATYKGIKSASCTNCDISVLSFHPVKHITTAEGGAITTNSKAIYEKALSLRNHGVIKTQEMKPWEYEMQSLGFNYRLSDIQCALGSSQLLKLDGFIKRRIEIAKKYDEAFQNTIVNPLYLYDTCSSYHLYVVKVDFSCLAISKQDLFMELRKRNIHIQLHYMPVNKQAYYRRLSYGNEHTPVMDEYYKQCFSLPIFPKLRDVEQDYVISNLLDILNK